MEIKTLQRYDENGFYSGQCYFQVLPGVYYPDNTTDTPLPENADLEANFYQWVDGAWKELKKPASAEELVGVVISHESQTPHDQEMRKLIQDCAKEDGYRLRDRSTDLSWEIEKIPEKTAEELEAEAAEQVRSKRDSLIAETDYLVMADYPIDEETLEAVKAYRQALRDIPQQEGFPFDVVWPEKVQVLVER